MRWLPTEFLFLFPFIKEFFQSCLNHFLPQNSQQPIVESQVLLKLNMGQKPFLPYLHKPTNYSFISESLIPKMVLKGRLDIKLVQFRSPILSMSCYVIQNSNFFFPEYQASPFSKDNKEIKTFWYCILLMFLSLRIFLLL